VLDIFKYPDIYEHFGTAIPKGILLHGPPGTGKTHFARVISNITDSMFFSASASQFDEVFVGKGAQRVRNLFEDARKYTEYSFTEKLSALLKRHTLKEKRVVIFIDELDAIGSRSPSAMGIQSVYHATVSQLLTCLDGLEARGNIFVIAATNNISQIDPAIRRSGRFDRVIEMTLPNEKSRQEILRFYLGDRPGVSSLEESGVLKSYAQDTEGFSAADLQTLANEAVMHAVHQTIEKRKSDLSTAGPSSSANQNCFIQEKDLKYAFETVLNKIRTERLLHPYSIPNKMDKLD